MGERLTQEQIRDLRALAKNGPCWGGVIKSGTIPIELQRLINMGLIRITGGLFAITGKGRRALKDIANG